MRRVGSAIFQPPSSSCGKAASTAFRACASPCAAAAIVVIEFSRAAGRCGSASPAKVAKVSRSCGGGNPVPPLCVVYRDLRSGQGCSGASRSPAEASSVSSIASACSASVLRICQARRSGTTSFHLVHEQIGEVVENPRVSQHHRGSTFPISSRPRRHHPSATTGRLASLATTPSALQVTAAPAALPNCSSMARLSR